MVVIVGIKCGFDHERLIYHLRVISVDGKRQICVRDKEADSINSMFFTRFELYKKGLLLCRPCISQNAMCSWWVG